MFHGGLLKERACRFSTSLFSFHRPRVRAADKDAHTKIQFCLEPRDSLTNAAAAGWLEFHIFHQILCSAPAITLGSLAHQIEVRPRRQVDFLWGAPPNS